ncbi:hypothetical protein RUND412_008153 [Rhizina undulata]
MSPFIRRSEHWKMGDLVEGFRTTPHPNYLRNTAPKETRDTSSALDFTPGVQQQKHFAV